jgi:hypothetical protein
MQNVHHSTWDHAILYADRVSKDELLIFVENQKHERGGQLKIKIPNSFYGDNAWTYDDVSKLWGYLGTNAEPPCVEFCNFV